ncbi:MAG TPA: S8 family serine peptidase [Candidatus Binatia bacterium]|nr:S8 family serine peptidase [Candidatus Binatia bacterium]
MTTIRIVALLGFVLLACGAHAAHGPDATSLKLGSALREAPFAARSSAPRVQAAEPWRQGSRVHVYVRVRSTDADVLSALRARGLEVVVVSDVFGGLVDGWADASTLPAIAALPAVTMIRPVAPPVTDAGAVVTAGDAALRADAVRAGGFTGAGVPLGLISDGISSAAMFQSTGELPAITVPPDPRCSSFDGDEGTAMLEIVHDVAPDAGPLFFASFGQSGAFMAEAVRCLADAGARVIVDDVTFGDEPFFQDGPLAIAAREVVQRGVTYHTSAGNRGREFLEEPLVATVFGPPLGVIHDFDPANGGDPGNEVLIGAGGGASCVLQWNEPFGAAATDLDLLVVQNDPNNVIAKSDNPQTGMQDPVEMVQINNPTDTDKRVSLVVQYFSGDPNRRFRLMCFRSREMEHVSAEGAIYGQQAVAEVMAVAAINMGDEGLDTVSAESSPGPATIFFPAAEVREKPDITSFDGVETAVGQAGLFPNPFFGTSAAAPHAGAVAALMLSKNPSLSPAQIQQIMKATAVDIGAPGFDRRAGAGRLDALAAVAGVPCPDVDALPAQASCGGDKAPKPALAAYRSARRQLVAATGTTGKKASRKAAAAFRLVAKGQRIVDKQAGKGKVTPSCAASLRGALSLVGTALTCRFPG